jgi:hypothetical protein
VWAAPELLGAPTIGRGSAQSRGGGGGGCRSQISLQSRPKNTKTAKKRAVSQHVLAYKLPKMLFFTQKYFKRYTHKMFFEEYINFKLFIT